MRVKLVTLILGAACLTSVLLGCNGGTSEGEAVTHYHAGVGTQDEGRLQERIEEYDQVIRLSPQDANAYLTRGNAFNDLEQYQRAIEDYGEAILSIPIWPWPTTTGLLHSLTWARTSEPSKTWTKPFASTLNTPRPTPTEQFQILTSVMMQRPSKTLIEEWRWALTGQR